MTEANRLPALSLRVTVAPEPGAQHIVPPAVSGPAAASSVLMQGQVLRGGALLPPSQDLVQIIRLCRNGIQGGRRATAVAVPWRGGRPFDGSAHAELMADPDLARVKAESQARADRNAYPATGLRPDDVREALSHIDSLDRD